ncbi:hypothetical protein [Methylophaga sp. OBS4]|uniref:hypothetical protein n=1 Tax=Methylophaga sp. OBS4 TaxID=2991935 RepID=UPI0022568AEC|nr:hypothetical protein [Methylophaga sp. OBS4]MCX4188165.1 hypothetical protein [Methylophaga sp. OBS4]
MRKIFKNFLSALIQNAFIAVIIAIVTVPVLVSVVTGTIDLLIQNLSYDAPVWLVILCTFTGICYVHFSSRNKTKDTQPETKKFLIEDSGFKWRVIDHENGFSSVEQIPLCTVHECEYVLTPGDQYMCRETIASECHEKILEPTELTFYWNLAKSKANSIINKYETKH